MGSPDPNKPPDAAKSRRGFLGTLLQGLATVGLSTAAAALPAKNELIEHEKLVQNLRAALGEKNKLAVQLRELALQNEKLRKAQFVEEDESRRTWSGWDAGSFRGSCSTYC